MSEVGHVVVMGGGAAGCATAYALSTAGIPVTIVEREGIGSQASGWSAGGVNPLEGIPAPLGPLAMASYRLHLKLWPELTRLTGQSFEARVISKALVAPDTASVSPLLELRDEFADADGFSARWLDETELRILEPRIAPGVAGALLTHGNGVVDSHAFTVALAEAARRHGASIRTGAVIGIQHADHRVTGVQLADGVVPCDAVVVAMGPWAQAAEAWLGCPLPIEPLKGEILRLAAPSPPLALDVVGPNVSLFTRAGDQVWLGSTRERRGFDKEPSETAYQTLRDAALGLMPALADVPVVQQTACLRPSTPDDVPILGAVPGWEGAYVATGGGPKGILLAPAMGQALADLIQAGRTTLPIEACDPARFVKVNA